MQNGKKIYLCKRIEDGNVGIERYGNPISFTLGFNHLTLQPASGYLALREFGEDISKTWIMLANANEFNGVFKEKDVLYIDGKTPSKNEINGEKANAVITSVLEQNFLIRITLSKRDV